MKANFLCDLTAVIFHVTHHVNSTCDRDSAAPPHPTPPIACLLTRSCYMLKLAEMRRRRTRRKRGRRVNDMT